MSADVAMSMDSDSSHSSDSSYSSGDLSTDHHFDNWASTHFREEEYVGSIPEMEVEVLVQESMFDADNLVAKLVAKNSNMCQDGKIRFDWDHFGTESTRLFVAAPANISFMNGWIDSPRLPQELGDQQDSLSPQQQSRSTTLPPTVNPMGEAYNLYTSLCRRPWKGCIPFPMDKGATGQSVTVDLCSYFKMKTRKEAGYLPKKSTPEEHRATRLYFPPNSYPPPQITDKGELHPECEAYGKLKWDLATAAHNAGCPIVSNGSNDGENGDRMFVCAFKYRAYQKSKDALSSGFRQDSAVNSDKNGRRPNGRSKGRRSLSKLAMPDEVTCKFRLVVGWDGYVFPYAFSIHDFEPITGRVHQPPPVHQTFAARNFVICSFVPRLYDYHPDAIPAPYNHSNIDSDEVLYYVDGDFMSRKNVDKGQITLHPGGIPHGPHPGTVEKSIGAKETHELAVMVDTFRPLLMTEHAAAIEDKDYFLSWLNGH